MKNVISLGSLAVLSSFAAQASAQSLGAEGDFSVAIERLSGLGMGTLSIDPEGPIDESDTEYVSLRLLTSQGASTGPLTAALPVFSMPRVAADYFLAPQISLGGTFGIVGTSWEEEGGGDFGATTVLFSGRLGYWLPLNETLSFWPRGGLTILYVTQGDDDDVSEVSATVPALSLEAPLMIALGPAFLQAAITLDISIAGSGESQTGATSTDFDVSAYELGLQAGLGIAF